MDVTSCETDGDTTLNLTAETETADLTVEVTEQGSSVLLESADGGGEGEVDSFTAGDSGSVTVNGTIAVGDNDEAADFLLEADCS